MRATTFLSTLLAATAATTVTASPNDDENNHHLLLAPIYIQPILISSSSSNSAPPPPTLLAEIQYPSLSSSDPDSGSTRPEVISYEAPDLSFSDSSSSPESTQQQQQKLVRIGIYDAQAKKWISSTSVVSASNFGKGYSPHFVLTLDEDKEREERVVGVTVRGVKVDAGHTRDFGPQVVVARIGAGKQPNLGRDVKLSAEGRKVAEEGEKGFLQKYWWAIAIGAVLMLGGGGGDGK
ncbi:hypothetical protein QBC44DRAFT_293469 [Cladorrhinum sp. PSN332]|nr:hypothetical protein QBC44DRAFT_293469 [Cladorrhinum sp. PSN332]